MELADSNSKAKQRRNFILFVIIALVCIFYVSARTQYVIDTAEGTPLFMGIIMGLTSMFDAPLAVSFGGDFLTTFGLLAFCTAIIAWVVYDKNSLNKHYTEGEECGTAKWQDENSIKEYNKKFTEPIGKTEVSGPQNTLYSKHCALSMDTHHTGLNNNAMVIGGPGSGKSFNIVRPNLLQAYGSYVVTDPSGELLATTGKFFEDRGYDIRVFNLTDLPHSHRYNPFRYLRSEDDVMTLINCLIKNTETGNKNGGDPFWEKAETALLEAIIFYLVRYKGKDKQNFSMVSKLLRQAKADPKTMKSQLDTIFEGVRAVNPDDICVKQYDIFKQASDKTAQSILITAAVRLAPFNIETVENLTCEDDMDLKSIGDKPTITYIIVPQGNNPYGFLVNMMYSQMFDTLYYHAAMDCPGIRLKYDVRFILDEFANIGVIPDFQVKLTTMRKYGLSCMIFIQAVGQIKNLYKDDWETLMGACDAYVYLGGNELSTMEDLSKKLGDQTIRVKDSSTSHSGKGGGSDSKSYKNTKRALLTVDEIRRLKDGCCIILIKGQQPFYDEKYSTFDHPNAKYLGNLSTDENIYHFDYCNTKAEDYDKLAKRKEEQRRAAQRQVMEKRGKQGKVIQSYNVTESDASKEEEKEMAKVIRDSAVAPIVNTDRVLERGGQIVEGPAQQMKRTAINGVNSFASSNSVNKPSLGPNMASGSTDSTMDDLDEVLSSMF